MQKYEPLLPIMVQKCDRPQNPQGPSPSTADPVLCPEAHTHSPPQCTPHALHRPRSRVPFWMPSELCQQNSVTPSSGLWKATPLTSSCSDCVSLTPLGVYILTSLFPGPSCPWHFHTFLTFPKLALAEHGFCPPSGLQSIPRLTASLVQRWQQNHRTLRKLSRPVTHCLHNLPDPLA